MRVLHRLGWPLVLMSLLLGTITGCQVELPAPERVVAPPLLGPEQPELVAPLRGFYQWNGRSTVPLPRLPADSYRRYLWAELEDGRGYHFAPLEADLAAAALAGRKHGLRIRAVAAGTAEGVQIPADLAEEIERGWNYDRDDDGRDELYVPDWNDPEFIARAEALIAALGERYDRDPRVGWVEIGIYGNWGEWHVHEFPYPQPNGAVPMSQANRQRIIDAHLRAFPNTQLIMMSDDAESLVYALRQSPTVGWRRDSLGSPHFASLRERVLALPDGEAAWQLVSERWQSAPVISEWINRDHPNRPEEPLDFFQLGAEQVAEFHISLVSNGNTYAWQELDLAERLALQQVGKTAGYRLALRELRLPAWVRPGDRLSLRTTWQNDGVAPLYEAWQPELLLQAGRSEPIVLPFALDLRTVLPGKPFRSAAQIALPRDVPTGNYRVGLRFNDPLGYREALPLALTIPADDGIYWLTTIEIR